MTRIPLYIGFFFLFLLPSVANAATMDYINDFPVYVFGDVEAIASIFNGIAMIVGSNDFQNLMGLAAIFLVYLIGKQVAMGEFLGATKETAFIVAGIFILSNTTLSPTVHVMDQRATHNSLHSTYTAGDGSLVTVSSYEAIDNVPWVVASIASVSSTITMELAELIDVAFSTVGTTVDDNGLYTRLGFMQQTKTLMDIMDKTGLNNDTDLSRFGMAFSAYVEYCAVKSAMSVDNTRFINISNPPETIFNSISPTTLEITDSDKVWYRSVEVGCKTFWDNEIVGTGFDNLTLKQAADRLFARADQIIGKLKIDELKDVYTGELGAGVTNTILGDTTAQFSSYLLERSVAPNVQQALRNASMGVDVSGQEMINQVTADATTAQIQTEGIGQLKWLGDILPFAVHFILGIIYALGIFVALVAFFSGYQAGIPIIKNYFMGVITFEMVRVSMALVHALTQQYAAYHAADRVTFLGSNPASFQNIPAYYDWLATMTGTAGIIGVAMVFMIPAMIFTGQVGAALGAISGVASRYKGNDVQTAQQLGSQEASGQAVIGRVRSDADAAAWFAQRGMSVPSNVGALQYYSSFQQGLNSAVQGMTMAGMSDDAGDIAMGNVKQGVKQLSHTASYGENVSMGGAEGAGSVTGQTAAIQDKNTATMEGNRDYMVGVDRQSRMALNKTAGFGGQQMDNSAENIGQGMGAKEAGFMDQTYQADKDAGVLTGGNQMSDTARSGAYNKARDQAEGMMGMGEVAPSESDWKNKRKASDIGFDASFADAAGLNRAVDSVGRESYMQAKKDGAILDTAQNVGRAEGTMDAMREGAREAGREIGEHIARTMSNTTYTQTRGQQGQSGVIEELGREKAGDVSETHARTRTLSEASAIDRIDDGSKTPMSWKQKQERFIRNQTRKTVSDTQSLESSIRSADERLGEGGFEQANRTLAGAKTAGDAKRAQVGEAELRRLSEVAVDSDIAGQQEQIRVAEQLAQSELGEKLGLIDSKGKPLRGGEAVAQLKRSTTRLQRGMVTQDGEASYDARVAQNGDVDIAVYQHGTQSNPLDEIMEGVYEVTGGREAAQTVLGMLGGGLAMWGARKGIPALAKSATNRFRRNATDAVNPDLPGPEMATRASTKPENNTISTESRGDSDIIHSKTDFSKSTSTAGVDMSGAKVDGNTVSFGSEPHTPKGGGGKGGIFTTAAIAAAGVVGASLPTWASDTMGTLDGMTSIFSGARTDAGGGTVAPPPGMTQQQFQAATQQLNIGGGTPSQVQVSAPVTSSAVSTPASAPTQSLGEQLRTPDAMQAFGEAMQQANLNSNSSGPGGASSIEQFFTQQQQRIGGITDSMEEVQAVSTFSAENTAATIERLQQIESKLRARR